MLEWNVSKEVAWLSLDVSGRHRQAYVLCLESLRTRQCSDVTQHPVSWLRSLSAPRGSFWGCLSAKPLPAHIYACTHAHKYARMCHAEIPT